MIQIQHFAVNMLQENCYILSDETHEAVIIDCGAYFDEEFQAIDEYIASQQLKPLHHVLTHGHFDHVFGARHIYDKYGLQPEMHGLDTETYRLQPQQLQLFLHRAIPLSLPEVGHLLTEGEEVTFGTHRLRVIHTPGHTPGGICLYEAEEEILLSGDSLFLSSIGRCDLPGGDPVALHDALVEKVMTLPDTTRVLPGHGPETDIGYERKHNPFLAV